VFAAAPPVPPDEPTIEARMVRHRWAADRLWEGVVGNSNRAWREGLEVLVTAPLDDDSENARFARKLQRQAIEALAPSPGPLVERGASYGEILVTCASCHAARPLHEE
jgi:hypothetical protein